jgi:filamentous hemagglutinin family protein
MLYSISLLLSGVVQAASGGGLIADGTAGTQITQLGQAFVIEGGTARGANLLHSFQEFNVESGQMADFQAAYDTQYIISRVTGPNDSWIDGTIHSGTSQADVYLVNPNGVVFGKNASLSVQGAFHVSTADYVTLADGQRVYTDSNQGVNLTVAAPEAFGFLDADVGAIQVQGSRLVNRGKSISLTGGEITLEPGSELQIERIDYLKDNTKRFDIRLTGVASSAEIPIAPDGWSEKQPTQFAPVTLTQSTLDTNHNFRSRINITGDQVTLQDSRIIARSSDAESGLGVVYLRAQEQLNLIRTLVDTSTDEIGNAGSISLQAPQIVLDNRQADSDVGLHSDASGADHYRQAELVLELEIQHTAVGDLTAILTSPAGTELTLFSQVGGDGDDFFNTVFYDGAEQGVETGYAPFYGEFRPQQPFSTLHGEAVAGDWQLSIQDSVTDNPGQLFAWWLGAGPNSAHSDDGPLAILDHQTTRSTLTIQDTRATLGEPIPPGLPGTIRLQATEQLQVWQDQPGTMITAQSVTGPTSGTIQIETPELRVNGAPIGQSSFRAEAGAVYFERHNIVLDGSLGQAQRLSGPDYRIPAGWGTLRGANLFHSFAAFNLAAWESAVFSGPDTVRHIIARVQGPVSEINGTLRSEIPDAGFWLINPAGIQFGDQATLELTGALHLSTADYLQFADDSRWYVTEVLSEGVLSVASPESFGFLDAPAGAIQIQGSQLQLGAGEAMHLVGGEISLASGAQLQVAGGQIHIEGDQIALQDSVLSTRTEVATSSSDITLQAQSELELNRSLIDTSVDTGPAGDIHLQAGQSIQVRQDNPPQAMLTAQAPAEPGEIWLDTPELRVNAAEAAESAFWLEAGVGYFGRQNIVLDGRLGGLQQPHGADYVIPAAWGRRAGRHVFHSFSRFNLAPWESATFTGPDDIRQIVARVQGPTSELHGQLRTDIQDADLWLLNPAGILIGEKATLDLAGSLYLRAADDLHLADAQTTGTIQIAGSQLQVNAGETLSLAGGDITLTDRAQLQAAAGAINLTGDQITLQDSTLQAHTLAGGTSEIAIQARTELNLIRSLLDTSANGLGDAGNIQVQAPNIVLDTRGADREVGLRSDVLSDPSGQPGTIRLQATEQLHVWHEQPQLALTAHAIGDQTSNTIQVDTPELRVNDASALDSQFWQEAGQGYFGRQNVVLDDRFGDTRRLQGPDYQVPAEWGLTQGSNLYHSFAVFNLDAWESATFSGPLGIRHIIARVQGPATTLNGQLRNEIAGADLWLVNPAGIVTKEYATLDLAGALHLSTVDYVRFADHTRFQAGATRDAVFSGTEPVALGFADADIAPIHLQGSQFYMLPEQTLNVVGGAVTAQQTELVAVGGNINLMAAASAGEIQIGGERYNTTQPADITLTDSVLSVTNQPDSKIVGNIRIRGDQVIQSGGEVAVNNRSDVDASQSGLRVQATDILLTDNAHMSSATTGTGDGSNISLLAEDSVGLAQSNITVTTLSTEPGAGSGGVFLVDAATIRLRQGTTLNAFTMGLGMGGEVNLRATQTVDIDNSEIQLMNWGSMANAGDGGLLDISAGEDIRIMQSDIEALNFGTGLGGNVDLQAGNTVLIADSYIATLTTPTGVKNHSGDISIAGTDILIGDTIISASTHGSGDAGLINLYADQSVFVTNALVDIRASGHAADPGQGGVMRIQANDIELQWTTVQTESFNTAQGGSVYLIADQRATLGASSIRAMSHHGPVGDMVIQAADIRLYGKSGIIMLSFGIAEEGMVHLRASKSVLLEDESFIDLELLSSYQVELDTVTHLGRGAGLLIEAADITLTGGAWINASTQSVASGGIVQLVATDQIHLDGRGTLVSNSSHGPANAGNIHLQAADLILADGAVIASTSGFIHHKSREGSARTGSAGEIRIDLHGTLSMGGGSEISTATIGAGAAGSILIGEAMRPATLQMEGGSQVSSDSKLQAADAGAAGKITVLTGETIELKDDSQITTSSQQAGGGGIRVETRDRLHLQDSRISTSVAGGIGQGGNIEIDPVFVILENSQIQANAHGGPGGNITLVADYLLQSGPSVIEASSALSTPGNVDVQAVNIDGSTLQVAAATAPLNADQWQQVACHLRRGKVSRLIMAGYDAHPTPVDDLLSSLPLRATLLQTELLPSDSQVPATPSAVPVVPPTTMAPVMQQGYQLAGAGSDTGCVAL